MKWHASRLWVGLVVAGLGTGAGCRSAAPKPRTASSPSADPKSDRWEERTLVNRRVRYSIPSYWTAQRSATDTLNERQAPFTAGMWYTFPFPWPEGKDPSYHMPMALFSKKSVFVNLECSLTTSPLETLAEFSERRRRPLPEERVVSDSVRKHERVIVSHARNGPETLERIMCFEVEGRVTVALLTAYTIDPKPPEPWLKTTRAHLQKVCRSIKIEKAD